MVKLKRVCGYCGGDGRLNNGDTYCPHCDTHAKDKPVSLYDVPNRELTPYMQIMADKRSFNFVEFDAYYAHLKGASEYVRFRMNINNLVAMVLKGEAPKTSYLIHMDNHDFIDRFASTYLCTAYKAGLSIFPFLDTSTINQLRGYKPIKLPTEIYGDLTILDAIQADVLCVDLVTNLELYISAGVVSYLITARSKLNKPTIVFTSSSGTELFKPELLGKISTLKEFRKMIKANKDNPSSCNDVLYVGLK